MLFVVSGEKVRGIFDGRMKDERSMIVCCLEGIPPVIMKIKRLPDPGSSLKWYDSQGVQRCERANAPDVMNFPVPM
jgi:hypothetical protein